MKTDLISRRSFLSVVGAVGAAAALTACGGAAASTASSAAASSEAASSEAAGESVELIVFAAASLTETLNAIAQDYSAENPGVTFRFNFDSSGTLKTQIQEGADCDLFICRSEADEPAGHHRFCRREHRRSGLRGPLHPCGPAGKQGRPLCARGQRQGHRQL